MSIRIGIRPIIDGRGKVRDQLEEKTMNMARAAQKLIQSRVRGRDGLPAECLIGSTTISCRAEAVRVDAEFSSKNVVATLSVTPIFSYGTETLDFSPHTVKAVWGFNGTERPGAVYLACAMSGYADYGIPAFSIYGKDVQELDDDEIPPDVAEKILAFARCAVAVGEMRDRSYLSIGGVAMGISGSYMDPIVLHDYFGMRAEWVDMSEVQRRIQKGIYDKDEYARAAEWVKENIREGREYYNDENTRHGLAQKKRGLGDLHQNGAHLQRSDAGQFRPCGHGISRGEFRAECDRSGLSRTAPMDGLHAERRFCREHPQYLF